MSSSMTRNVDNTRARNHSVPTDAIPRSLVFTVIAFITLGGVAYSR